MQGSSWSRMWYQEILCLFVFVFKIRNNIVHLQDRDKAPVEREHLVITGKVRERPLIKQEKMGSRTQVMRLHFDGSRYFIHSKIRGGCCVRELMEKYVSFYCGKMRASLPECFLSLCVRQRHRLRETSH